MAPAGLSSGSHAARRRRVVRGVGVFSTHSKTKHANGSNRERIHKMMSKSSAQWSRQATPLRYATASLAAPPLVSRPQVPTLRGWFSYDCVIDVGL